MNKLNASLCLRTQRKGLARQGGRQGDSGGGGDRSLTRAVTRDVWTVEGVSGEPHTGHTDAFNMAASYLR